MFKLILVVFALMAVATAFPSGVDQTKPLQPRGLPQAGPVAISDDANKESLENAETFGYGYYNHYPRYYYGGYGYGYGYYPRYYYGYPNYYW